MGLQLTDAITVARGILQDTDSTNYRYSSADLLLYANDALDVMAELAPQLFYTYADHTCSVSTIFQTLSDSTYKALVEVRRIKNGSAVIPTTREALDAFDPTWTTATEAATVHWIPLPGEPRRFLVYPPVPAAGQTLEVTAVAVPSEYALTDDTGLPTTYKDAVADYIVYRAESRDDEHVNSNRAAQFLASFQQKVKGA